MSNKLFVGNLSFNTTENDLNDAFAAFGTVTETNLMMDRMSGKPRGFAFVTMSSPDEAQKAIEAMNGAQLDGRALTVLHPGFWNASAGPDFRDAVLQFAGEAPRGLEGVGIAHRHHVVEAQAQLTQQVGGLVHAVEQRMRGFVRDDIL